MDGQAITKQLSLQQSIPPIPNSGPGAAAWLRSFAGFSWLAYGAGGSVVIRSAPSPSAGGDNSASAFFQQVVSLSRGSESTQALAKQAVLDGDRIKGGVGISRKSDEEGGTNVECLAWAPQGAEQQGLLAVVCGFAVHILAPQNSEGTSPTGRTSVFGKRLEEHLSPIITRVDKYSFHVSVVLLLCLTMLKGGWKKIFH